MKANFKISPDICLSEYKNTILEDYAVDITSKKQTQKDIKLLLVFVKYVKVKYSGLRDLTIAEFLNRESKEILRYLVDHDKLYTQSQNFKHFSDYLRTKLRGIDSESLPTHWKELCNELIEISPENVREQIYYSIKQLHEQIKNKVTK
tara:strand:- start:652 stop:1095 length:444 start_codon:yes stop_codon:yes gene_type:complete